MLAVYPVGHASLRGLPPTLIINAEIDPLCGDGEMLAAALERAGVSVERQVHRGVTREFFGTAAAVAKAREAQALSGQWLQKSFAAMP